jgi:hypothetical protein
MVFHVRRIGEDDVAGRDPGGWYKATPSRPSGAGSAGPDTAPRPPSAGRAGPDVAPRLLDASRAKIASSPDLNGDGKPDLAVCDAPNGGPGSVTVLLNTTP